MGNVVSCVTSHRAPPQANYDMSRFRNRHVPIIWITGQSNTGKKTLGHLIKDRYEFEYINITDLLREESTKTTKRALSVNEALKANKKVNDTIVMDLLKEALLNSSNDKGFLIANFPKNTKQAERFVREIANTNFIFYFYSEIPLLIERAQEKSGVVIDPEILRRDIAVATRDLKMCLSRFTLKIESINTSGLPEETFVKVENALIRRINVRPIKTETDYVQPQQSKIKHVPPPPALNYQDEHGIKDANLVIEPKKDSSPVNIKKESKTGKIGFIIDIKEKSSSKISPSEKKEEKKTEKLDEDEDKKHAKNEEEESLKNNEQEQSVDEDDSVSLDF